MDSPEFLSKLLFEAQEVVAMYAEVVASRTGKYSAHLATLKGQIENYRKHQGWSLDGFGGESDVSEGTADE